MPFQLQSLDELCSFLVASGFSGRAVSNSVFLEYCTPGRQPTCLEQPASEKRRLLEFVLSNSIWALASGLRYIANLLICLQIGRRS